MTTHSTIGVTSSTGEIIEYIKLLNDFDGVKIGALGDLKHFYKHTAHVICFVKEDESTENNRPSGICVYMIITKNGFVSIELCQTLNQFWGYWHWQGEAIFPDIASVLYEIEYFFESKKPKCSEDYKFEDGLQNQRVFREMRSVQKCNELKSTFGLDLIPVA